ncbi:glutaredoxin domain-containing protein [Bacillus sp. SCS-151]|uniref:glutaredoxin domain-containing protein n=1 Tax=Nanhaiella sioensis TaxID=3115293 RepID=UPI00397D64E0
MRSITVYSQPDCPPCEVVKKFLAHHKITYQEIDITKNKRERERLINEYKAYSTPTIIIDDEIVKGFDLTKLANILNIEE